MLRPTRLGRTGRRLVVAALGLCSLVGGAALLLRWGLLCTSAVVWQKINRVCVEYMSGEAIGNLCQPLCVLDDIQSITCQQSLGRNEIVFAASWNSKKLLIKAPTKVTVFTSDVLYWVDEKNQRHYPSDEEFTKMIKELVLLKTNISISDNKAEELSHLPKDDSNQIIQGDVSVRTAEMDNAWALLQDYDYLMTNIFSGTGLFPRKVGSCGALYAVEHAEPLKSISTLFAMEESLEEWERRSRLAILILELLEKFDKAKLRLCDVELSHFGASGGRLRYLDLSGVKTKKSTCYPGEEGNLDNLQAICEKVFLGWAVRARVLIPGLLVSQRAPHSLTTLLRRCADPYAPPPSKDFRRSLYNNLIKRN